MATNRRRITEDVDSLRREARAMAEVIGIPIFNSRYPSRVESYKDGVFTLMLKSGKIEVAFANGAFYTTWSNKSAGFARVYKNRELIQEDVDPEIKRLRGLGPAMRIRHLEDALVNCIQCSGVEQRAKLQDVFDRYIDWNEQSARASGIPMEKRFSKSTMKLLEMIDKGLGDGVGTGQFDGEDEVG